MPQVMTKKQEHQKDCLVWVSIYEVPAYEVRYCKHNILQIASLVDMYHLKRLWKDLSFILHPIVYIRATTALRREHHAQTRP